LKIQLYMDLGSIRKYKKGESFKAYSQKSSSDQLFVIVPIEAVASVENNLDYDIFNIKPSSEWKESDSVVKNEESGNSIASGYSVDSFYENDELVLKTNFSTKDITLTLPKQEIEGNGIEKTMRVVMANTLILAETVIKTLYEEKRAEKE
jgi:hypothetical protein